MRIIALVTFLLLQLSSATINVKTCSCGFLDPRTGAVWTDAIITYGNETEQLPADSLIAEDFQHATEKNWNARFRAGAVAANLRHDKSAHGGAWTLSIDRPTRNHAVVGASLQSLRRDILYGSFEATLTSPPPNVGGSVLAMRLDYQETQTLNLNVMNADDPKNAWASFKMQDEWRGAKTTGVGFKDLSNQAINPWNLVSYRIEWTDKNVNYYIGDVLFRSISVQEMPERWPTIPSTFYIRHSSVGDEYTSQGPPPNGSHAHLGMIRAFFNSSQMSTSAHESFDSRCYSQPQCMLTDTSLRGSSLYMAASKHPYREHAIQRQRPKSAVSIGSTFILLSAALILHALVKRAPLRATHLASYQSQNVSSKNVQMSRRTIQILSTGPSAHVHEKRMMAQYPGTHTLKDSIPGTATPTGHSNSSTIVPDLPVGSNVSSLERVNTYTWTTATSERNGETRTSIDEKVQRNKSGHFSRVTTKLPRTAVGITASVVNPASKQRVDHLAGLVALASLLVTLIHFCMTFYPATEMPFSDAHYESERWFYKIITPYLMNFSWIGPFFTTSTRFLVMGYLKTGDLKIIANKAVTRAPRLIIPCVAMATLQYICINAGAVRWIEHLPSVSWSTWPFVLKYDSLWQFLNVLIELVYFVPNGVPRITGNYCIGVLWTIPVQLQNSWTSLLAVVVIREIKTPWKRMVYYASCIVVHWYAMSWGSFFLVGLLIADLDISYNWKSWLYARPRVYYPVLGFVLLLAVGSPAVDSIGHWSATNFSTMEHGVHPDQRTGRPIRESPDYGYPPYFVPRLTALTFSAGLHLLVELSPAVQRAMSNRLLMWVFPHILTLYLIHGLVFWSLGAFLCIKLAAAGVPYWMNIFIVAICCYIVVFASLPILTRIIETLGTSVTAKIWRDASEKPTKQLTTLYPFGPEILKDGAKNVATKTKNIDLEQNVDHHGQTYLYNAKIRGPVHPASN